MAFELRPDSFQFTFKPENANQKFPALQIEMKIGEEPVKLGVWMRTGQYGTSFTGKTGDLQRFMLALFGRTTKAADKAAPASAGSTQQATRPPAQVQASAIKDDAQGWD